MYKLLKMTFGEPVQILEEDTELMSIKFYSQTLWTTLNVSLLDKKLGEAFIFSLCKGGSRPGPRSTTQRPSCRPPNQRQPTGPHFCPSTGRRGNLWPTGLTAQKPTLNRGPFPISHCLNSSLISVALCFW